MFRNLLTADIAIWAGGAALNQKRITIPNTTLLTCIEDVTELISQ